MTHQKLIFYSLLLITTLHAEDISSPELSMDNMEINNSVDEANNDQTTRSCKIKSFHSICTCNLKVNSTLISDGTTIINGPLIIDGVTFQVPQYGYFINTTGQTIVFTPALVTFNSAALNSSGVTLTSSNQITLANAGVYQVTWI